MKKIFSFIGCVGLMLLALTACSPEEYSSANQSGIPSIEDINPVIEVDQETNTVVFSIDNPGCYPIWTIDGVNGHPTTNGLSKVYVVAGTYHYSVQIANRNGVAEGTYEGTFEIETTRFDFSDAIQKLTGGSSKQWRVYAAKKGHLGCGENLGNPLLWYQAVPFEKENNTIYDDFITFTKTDDAAGVDYSYDAGEDGYTFMNKGISIFPGSDGSNDFDAQAVGNAGAQTDVHSTLSYDGDNDMVTFTLPAMTLFPYLADDAQLNGATEYYITDLGDKTITVVLNLPGISWQLILINGEDEAVEEEFDPENVNWADVDSPANIGAAFNAKAMTFWWASWGWSNNSDTTHDSEPTYTFENGVHSLITTCGGEAQWMGQCKLEDVPMSIEAEQAYDISVDIDASVAYDNMTLKICQADNDDAVLVVKGPGEAKLKKGVNKVRFAKIFAGASFDQAKLLFDFGQRDGGEEFKISNIIVQKHNPK